MGVRPLCSMMHTLMHRFRFVGDHLYYIVYELVKNSMRASVESRSQWPIEIVIADSDRDVAIKVSDRGGGIPRADQSKIWSFKYTTAQEPVEDFNFLIGGPSESGAAESVAGRDQPPMCAPMAGFGFGLPLSRLYARYFGGDLIVMSIDGWGTDAYLHLNKLGDQQEALPV